MNRLLSILLFLFSNICCIEITVNSNGDDPAVDSTVSSLTASGVTTLRSAIEFANANFDVSNIINFDIPGSGVQTIDVGTGLGVGGTALPDIIKPLVINGYTQPDSKAFTNTTTATILIELNGEAVQSGSDGIILSVGSNGSQIKGLIINRFPRNGIFILSDNNRILGNYIGTDSTGSSALQNGANAIDIGGAESRNNIIAERNLISGNQGDGIAISGSNNQVIGNYIGTDATGTQALANEIGIDLQSTADNNIIKCNLIAFNNSWGIAVNEGTGNSILSNSIHSNAKNGISLLNNGNNNQSAPMITSATASGTTIGVTGIFSSMTNPNSVYRIEFFLNNTNQNPVTSGKSFIGSINITTNGTGDANFSTRLSSNALVGQFISATATLLNGTETGNTSQYSFNRQFTEGPKENALSRTIFFKYSSSDNNICSLQ